MDRKKDNKNNNGNTMNVDMKKVMLIVRHKFGMSNVFGCKLNPLDEQIAEMISPKLHSALANGGKEENNSKNESANSFVSTGDDNIVAGSEKIESSTDDSGNSRSKEKLKPIKMTSLKEFLAVPLTRTSQCSKMSERQYEDHMVRYIENSPRNQFFFCPYCDKRTQFGDHVSTNIHMYKCLERNGRNLSPSKVCTLKLFLSHPLIEEQNTKTVLKPISRPSVTNNSETKKTSTYTIEERKEIKNIIESNNRLLNLCPYCKHRPAVGNYFNVINHMKKCPARGNEILKPIPTLNEFLAIPPLTGSQFAKLNNEKHEESMVRYIENTFRCKFYYCSYCEKRTQFGNFRSTNCLVTCLNALKEKVVIFVQLK